MAQLQPARGPGQVRFEDEVREPIQAPDPPQGILIDILEDGNNPGRNEGNENPPGNVEPQEDGEPVCNAIDEQVQVQNIELEFKQENNPAPEGSECTMHFVRDIFMFRERQASPKQFKGILDEGISHLEFTLVGETDNEHLNLMICEHLSLSALPKTLSKFQQAEVLLQFFKINPDKTRTLIEEEPTPGSSKTLQMCLDLPNSKLVQRDPNLYRIQENENNFYVSCTNVIKKATIESNLLQREHHDVIIMRIYLKLVNGELNTLYGIQKSLQPDKEMYDLQNTMFKMLNRQLHADFILRTGDGKYGYKAHGYVLSANSDVFKTMLSVDMRERNSHQVSMPEYVTLEVLGAFLKYIYLRERDDLNDDPYRTIDVLQLAHFYNVKGLVDACEESLLAMALHQFSTEKALYLFRISSLTERIALQTKAVQIIMRLKVKFSEDEDYLQFAGRDPAISAKLTEMISQFQMENSA